MNHQAAVRVCRSYWRGSEGWPQAGEDKLPESCAGSHGRQHSGRDPAQNENVASVPVPAGRVFRCEPADPPRRAREPRPIHGLHRERWSRALRKRATSAGTSQPRYELLSGLSREALFSEFSIHINSNWRSLLAQKCHVPGADVFRFRARDLVLQKVECRPHLHREVVTAQSAQNFPRLKKECPVTCLCSFVRQQRRRTAESFMSIQFDHGY